VYAARISKTPAADSVVPVEAAPSVSSSRDSYDAIHTSTLRRSGLPQNAQWCDVDGATWIVLDPWVAVWYRLAETSVRTR
jgi:hypothetical protein